MIMRSFDINKDPLGSQEKDEEFLTPYMSQLGH